MSFALKSAILSRNRQGTGEVAVWLHETHMNTKFSKHFTLSKFFGDAVSTYALWTVSPEFAAK